MAQSIKVAVRARPLNQRERDLDCPVVVSMQEKTTTVHSPDKGLKHFTYDYVYSSIFMEDADSATQADIFEDIGTAMLSNAIDGFNGTLFAYGQTGSGKSYTMMGMPGEEGMIPRMIEHMFQRKAEIEMDPQKELQVWISYLEIYKERLTDLFDAVNKQEQVKIMEHPKLGVYVRGAQEVPCESKEDVMTNLDYGLTKRSIAATNMNNTSSRSHAVFCIRTTMLEGMRPSSRKSAIKDERKALHAKLNLIDLAGSERASKAGTENERLKEGSAINQSLSALGIVIKTLAETKEAKAPFRASKLTFLLKDSLAGNSRTYMMATVSPASDNLDETLSTLRFASSVKTIQTVPVQNKDKKDQLIDSLQEEMKLLKAQLAVGGINSQEAMEQLRERERLIKDKLHMDFQEDLKVAKEFQKARTDALEHNGLAQQHITQAFGISNDGMPYLVNMAFDPMLAGCLIYLIKESSATTIGAHKDNTIVLNGIGVPDFLCKLEHTATSGTSIRRLGDAGRVGVNGKMLKPGEELHIHHGDKVYLGRSYVLKLVNPRAGAGTPGPLDKRDLLLEGDGDADLAAALENSPSWTSLEIYIDQVLRQMPKNAAGKFLKELKTACRHSDEANELTAEFRKEQNLQLEVDITSSVPPCVVVRVLFLPPDRDYMDEGAWETKYLWSAAQLQERVERMRDYCGAVKLYGTTEVDPLEDPWHEAEPMEILQRVWHLGNVAEEAYNSMQQQLGKRSRSLRPDISILRLFFGFWKSSVSAWKRERKVGGDRSGRLGLVKSNGPSGKMRTTIIPPAAQAPQQAAARRKTIKQVAEEKAKKKAPVVVARPKVQSACSDVAPELESREASAAARLDVRSEAEATPRLQAAGWLAGDEAPEATPEVVAGCSHGRSISLESDDVLAIRQELDAAAKAARAAEAQVTQLSQENEALQRRLKGKQEHIEDLSNQLEVAWQLSSVLRDMLVAKKKSQAQDTMAATPAHPNARPAAPPEPDPPDPPDVLATAEALAATVQSVTAAAKAAQAHLPFRTGSCSPGRVSPQRVVAVPSNVALAYSSLAWCNSAPGTPGTTRAPSPPGPPLPPLPAQSRQTSSPGTPRPCWPGACYNAPGSRPASPAGWLLTTSSSRSSAIRRRSRSPLAPGGVAPLQVGPVLSPGRFHRIQSWRSAPASVPPARLQSELASVPRTAPPRQPSPAPPRLLKADAATARALAGLCK